MRMIRIKIPARIAAIMRNFQPAIPPLHSAFDGLVRQQKIPSSHHLIDCFREHVRRTIAHCKGQEYVRKSRALGAEIYHPFDRKKDFQRTSPSTDRTQSNPATCHAMKLSNSIRITAKKQKLAALPQTNRLSGIDFFISSSQQFVTDFFFSPWPNFPAGDTSLKIVTCDKLSMML